MNAPVKIRRAVLSDFEAIVALERATEFAPHWPPSAYAAILNSAATEQAACDPMRCLFVAESPVPADGPLAGFAVGLVHPAPVQDDCIAELESVAVAASARRSGIGRALCLAVIDWCRAHGAAAIVLEVRAGSAPAIALYTALGFRQTGRRPHYYREPVDDAVILQLRLEPARTPTSPSDPAGAPA